VPLPITGEAACAAIEGTFYVFQSTCRAGVGAEDAEGTIYFQANDDTIPRRVPGAPGCDPVMVVTETDLWLAMRGHVFFYERERVSLVDEEALPDFDRERFSAVVRGRELILAGGREAQVRSSGGKVARIVNGRLEVADEELLQGAVVVALATRNHLGQRAPYALTEDGNLIDLTNGTSENVMAPAVAANVVDAVFLRDGRLLALTSNGVVLDGAELPLTDAPRERLLITIGGAVLLVGGASGVDLFVPPPKE
jgi:hypothetical protein